MGRHRSSRHIHSQQVHLSDCHSGHDHVSNGRFDYAREQLFEPHETHATRPLDLNSNNLLNSPLEQRAEQDNVWRWLSQTSDQQPHHWSDEKQVDDNRHLHSHGHTRRPEYSSWRPHGVVATVNEVHPARPLSFGHQKRSRRRRPESSDSSIISGPQVIAETPRKRHRPVSTRDNSSIPSNSRRDMPPPASSHRESPRFEKRPRHGTRGDKYETAKNKKSHSKQTSSKAHRKPDKKKRKGISTGKNVMSNFTSNAVLNDRITVSNIPRITSLFAVLTSR